MEAVEVDVGIVAEDAPLRPPLVVLGHRRPHTMPALLLLELECERSMALRPPVLPLLPYLREPFQTTRVSTGSWPGERLERLVGQRDGRGVSDGEPEVGVRRLGSAAGVEDGRVALEDLGHAAMVRVVADDEQLERAPIRAVEGDAGVRARSVHARELLANERGGFNADAVWAGIEREGAVARRRRDE